MQSINYQVETLKYILGYFRQNKDAVNFLKQLAVRGNSIGDAILTLLKSYEIRQARGVFLDYIGAEVGTKRDETNFSNYFCVNLHHINTDKLFYFLTSGSDPRTPIILEDAEFMQKIFAYIGTNTSSGNFEETLSIIKIITNADNIQITKGEQDGIKINILGSNSVLTENTVNYIKKVLGDGIYLEEITKNE